MFVSHLCSSRTVLNHGGAVLIIGFIETISLNIRVPTRISNVVVTYNKPHVHHPILQSFHILFFDVIEQTIDGDEHGVDWTLTLRGGGCPIQINVPLHDRLKLRCSGTPLGILIFPLCMIYPIIFTLDIPFRDKSPVGIPGLDHSSVVCESGKGVCEEGRLTSIF